MTNPELEHEADEAEIAGVELGESPDLLLRRRRTRQAALHQSLLASDDPLVNGHWNPGSRKKRDFEKGHRHATDQHRRFRRGYRHKSETTEFTGRGK